MRTRRGTDRSRNRWNITRALLLGAALASSIVGAAASPAAAGDETACVGTLSGRTFERVVVPSGAACILTDSVVRGDVRVLSHATLQGGRNTIGGSVLAKDADGVRVVENRIGGSVLISGGGPAPAGFPNTPEYLVCGDDLPNGQVVIEHVTGGVGVRFLSFAAGVEGCTHSNTLAKGSITVSDNNVIRLLRVQNNVMGQGNISVSGNRLSGSYALITDNALGNGSLVVAKNTVTGLEADVQSNSVAKNLAVVANTGPEDKFVTLNTVGNQLACERNEPPFVGGPNTAARTIGQCF